MVNRDEIIRMAREAGLIHFYDSEGHCSGVTDEPLITAEKDKNDERLVEILAPFADLVAAAARNQKWTREHWTDYERAIEAAEREACAEICDHLMDTAITKQMATAYGNAADAIRNKE